MMARLQLAACVVLVVVALAVGQPTKGCCLPDQWSSVVSDLATINSNAFSLLNLQYDFKEQKEAMVTTSLDPITKQSNVTSRTIIDYAHQTMYYLPMNDPSKCVKMPYIMGAVKCVPGNATYLGSTYLGPMGGSMQYDGWRFQMPNSNLYVTLALTTKGCTPLVEGVTTPGKPQNDKTLLFTAFQPKLSDPSAFNIPASCQK